MIRRQLVVVILTVLAFGGCSERAGPDLIAELQARIDASTEPALFAFTFEGSNQVLDCALPNRRFQVRVDRRAEAVAVSTTTSSLALRVEDRVLIHRSAFRSGSISTEWLGLDATTPAVHRRSVAAALGPDASSYALSARSPDSMRAIGLAAVTYAREVRTLGTARIGGEQADGYRVLPDPGAFPEAGDEAERGSFDVATLPTIDLWVGRDDTIVRLVVRTAEPGIGASGGWTLEPATVRPTPAPPPAEDVTEAASIAPANLVAPALDQCELGG